MHVERAQDGRIAGWRAWGAVVGLVVALTACGQADTAAPGAAGSAPTPTPTPGRYPPEVVLVFPSETLVLDTYTYCWSFGQVGECADGVPSDDPATVSVEQGATAEVRVDGPAPDRLTLSATRHDPMGTGRPLPVTDGAVTLDLAPGTWHVMSGAYWDDLGDASASAAIEVTTP